MIRRIDLRELRNLAIRPESIFMSRQVEVLGEREAMNMFRGTRFENALTGTALNFRDDSDCIEVTTYRLAGEGTTDETGVWMLRLLDVVCVEEDEVQLFPWYRPPCLIATPRTEQPRFLTTGFTTDVNDLREYTIEVRSWLPSGSPAGKVTFSWYCIVPVASFID